MYTNRTVDIIEAHDPSTPLFVYHAWQEAHTPNEVPDWELSPLSVEGGAQDAVGEEGATEATRRGGGDKGGNGGEGVGGDAGGVGGVRGGIQ